MLGKIEGGRRRGQQRMRWLDGITNSMDMRFEKAWRVGDGKGSLVGCSPWCCRVEHDLTTEQQQQQKVVLMSYSSRVDCIVFENEVVGWNQRLDGHEFEQAPGVGDGQGSLACCSPLGHKELDMTE